MRKLTFFQWFVICFVAVVALFFLNFLARTTQCLKEYYDCNRDFQGPAVYLSFRPSGTVLVDREGGVVMGFSPPLAEDLLSRDADGDGLNALSEYSQLTSDSSCDSDSDGVSDELDSSPNGSFATYEGRIETLVLQKHLRALGAQRVDGPVYFVRTACHQFLSSTDEFVVVNTDPRTFHFLKDAGLAENSVSVEKVLFIPGICYVIDASYACGSRCGSSRCYFVVDLPLVGPRVVGSFFSRVS
jgi:hypothetical protein